MTLQDPDAIASAPEAGLRYVSDESPGIRRTRAGSGFSYLGPDGKRIRDAGVLLRIKHLVTITRSLRATRSASSSRAKAANSTALN